MKLKTNKLFKIFFGLFILLIPWQTRYILVNWRLGEGLWEYGRLSIYLAMLILLLAGIFFIIGNKQELHFSKNKWLYLTFLYSIIVSFLSPLPLVTFYYLLIIYCAVLFGYLTKFVPKLFTLRLFLLSGLIQAIIALQQIFSQKIVANKFLGLAEHLPETLGASVIEFDGLRVLRAYGSLPHPNVLGGFLFVSIFIAIYLWLHFYQDSQKNKWSLDFIKKNFWNFLFIIISLVVCTYALLATFSRSAVLALIISLFSVLIINILKRNWLTINILIKYLLIFLMILVSFNLFFPGAWTSRLQVDGRLEEQSLQKRTESYQQFYLGNVVDILFGQGLGMNTVKFHEYHPDEPIYNAQPIHNIFMLALAEVGIIGVLLFLNILRLVIKGINKVDMMSTSLLLGLIVIGLFDHYLWTSWTGWLLMSLAVMNLYRYQE